MKPKARIKILIDAMMTLGLLFLMGYQFWGDSAHEWAGAGMFALFIAHHVLNLNWYKNLFRGRYTAVRVFRAAVDVLALLAMLALMYSGVVLSQYVFAFLPIEGGAALARLAHMLASYWGFVLMALHLGLHWGMFTGMARKAAGFKAPSRTRNIALALTGAAVAAYGLYAFLSRNLPSYMFLTTQFVFLDFSEPIPLFYLDYLAIIGLFILLGHYGAKAIGWISARKTRRKTDERTPDQSGG